MCAGTQKLGASPSGLGSASIRKTTLFHPRWCRNKREIKPRFMRVPFLGQQDPWRRAWQPTPVFLPGESHGQRSLSSVQFSSVAQSCPTLCDPMDCSLPWNLQGKNTGMSCHFLLQGIFQIQGSNLGLLHCRWILYSLSHQGSIYPFYVSLRYLLFSSRNWTC